MNEYWSNTLREIDPYIPGEQPKGDIIAKLNTNENPYPPSPKVIDAILKNTNNNLRLYPDPNCEELKDTVARYYRVHKNNIFVGNGSDEILAFCFAAFFNLNEEILFPDITYSFYPVYSKLFSIPFKEIRLDNDLSVSINDFMVQNGGIIIPNPNAPTGKCLGVHKIIPIIENSLRLKKVIIIDEAYIDFGGESLIPFVTRYPNLLIVQTLSKSRSLAGLRIGLAFGEEGLIEGLNRIKSSVNSYTLDRLAIAGAIEAFNDDQYFKTTCQKIIDTRNRIVPELVRLGFNVIPSKANFIFVTHNKFEAIGLLEQLRNRRIFVRHFRNRRIENYLRISIGTDWEMDQLLKTFKEIVHAQ